MEKMVEFTFRKTRIVFSWSKGHCFTNGQHYKINTTLILLQVIEMVILKLKKKIR